MLGMYTDTSGTTRIKDLPCWSILSAPMRMPVIFFAFPKAGFILRVMPATQNFSKEYRWPLVVPWCLVQSPMTVCLNIWFQTSRCCLRADWVMLNRRKINYHCCQFCPSPPAQWVLECLLSDVVLCGTRFCAVIYLVIVGRRSHSHSERCIQKCSTRQIKWMSVDSCRVRVDSTVCVTLCTTGAAQTSA